MFRWTPAGNVTAGSGLDVELARRVRVAMEDGESEEDEEEAAVKGTRTIETTNGQTSAGELLPSAIPLPPSVAPDGTSVALNVMGPGDGGRARGDETRGGCGGEEHLERVLRRRGRRQAGFSFVLRGNVRGYG
jgi:hypothetical protein